jgi:CubicO group peptidase (beta-lactamase class C family)
MRTRIHIFSVLVLIALLSPALSGASAVNGQIRLKSVSPERDYWPTDGWRNATPESVGLDSGRLNGMVDYIEREGLNIHSVVVVKSGYIVLEKYFDSRYDENRTHLLYSVTKSFTSSLIGIAIDKGYIDNVSQRLLSFFPNYQIANVDARRDRITIENLLTMRSGMVWDESSAPFTSPLNDVYHLIYEDGVGYCLNLDMDAEPGELWHYNTGASHLLAAIVQVATGMGTLEFAEENLFDPLGISPVYWSRDLAGWYTGGFDLQMSTRNMAKFGWLYLNNGTWDGQQIISKEWVQKSVATFTQFDNYTGYGYQWWTDPGLGMYYAAGLYGQFIFVIPDHDIVVAFTSGMSNDAAYPHDNLVARFVIPAELSNRYLTPSDIVNVVVGVLLVAPLMVAAIYVVFARRRRMS